MLICTVNDTFDAMEQLGMHRTVTPHHTTYAFGDNRGTGTVTITGILDWWYYLEMDYECAAPFDLEYHLTEPFISIGITDRLEADYRPKDNTDTFSVDASFFINIEGMRGPMHCPAGVRQKRRSIVIRSAAWSQYLLPALMNHPADDVLTLIRDAGKRCEPYIRRAISSFAFSGYRGEALKMQLNTLVTGLFTEIIHQADQPQGNRLAAKMSEADRAAIHQAQQILRQSLREAPTIDVLSRQVAMNRKKLQLCFQELCGMTIGDYLRACRMERAMELLHTDMLIRDISHEVGYSSPGRFSRAFEGIYQMTPSEYRENLVHGGQLVKVER